MGQDGRVGLEKEFGPIDAERGPSTGTSKRHKSFVAPRIGRDRTTIPAVFAFQYI